LKKALSTFFPTQGGTESSYTHFFLFGGAHKKFSPGDTEKYTLSRKKEGDTTNEVITTAALPKVFEKEALYRGFYGQC